jgi:hypothetical protein
MSYKSLVGSKFFVSTGLAAALTVTDISNAAAAVLTSAAHGLSNNDEFVLFSGWEDFDSSVFRASSVAANNITLAGYDSSNTDFYPQGSDAGTLQKVSGWQEIGQVLGIQGQGGEARSEELQPFDRRNGVRIDNGFTASSMTMTLGWDAQRTDQQALAAASKVRAKRAFKFLLPGPSYAYGYGTVSMPQMPIFEPTLKTRVQVNFDGLFTSFV